VIIPGELFVGEKWGFRKRNDKIRIKHLAVGLAPYGLLAVRN
jgi:hypothetical protein